MAVQLGEEEGPEPVQLGDVVFFSLDKVKDWKVTPLTSFGFYVSLISVGCMFNSGYMYVPKIATNCMLAADLMLMYPSLIRSLSRGSVSEDVSWGVGIPLGLLPVFVVVALAQQSVASGDLFVTYMQCSDL